MSTRHARTGVTAGVLVFAMAAFPTALVVTSVLSGAVGTVSETWWILNAFVVIGALAGVTGYLLAKALERVDREPGRTKPDAWVAFYVAVLVIAIGTSGIPIAMLAVMVNSDRSLESSGPWFFVWWTLLHLIVGGLAFGLGRLAFWRPGPVIDDTASATG
jgi:hypothetical protein